MSIVTKPDQALQKHGLRRLWKVPVSVGRVYWLIASLVLYAGIFAWYYHAIKTQQDPAPIDDPLRLFGIIAFVLVLATAAYSLRRRFIRSLPGKVQSWLWMHTWVGMITILIALLHENYTYVTHDFCQNLGCLTDTYWAGGALFSLIALVIVGIAGRLLDMWQTRTIAQDASNNGVGIVSALQERTLELEYTVERLSAGKSETFKQFCLQALKNRTTLNGAGLALAALDTHERADFQRAYETLTAQAQLVQSLQLQQRARSTMRIWRYLHITLACIALLVISYHAIMELLTNVFHLFPPA